MPAKSTHPQQHENSRSGACIVQVDNVQYRYPGASAPALIDINFRIEAGSCFGLLGPNGAGKTTMISLLTGLLPLQAGEIRVGGHSFPGETRRIKQMSALVPQDYAFYPALTGRENLQFFAGLYEIPARELGTRMDHSIAVCGLEKVLDQRSCDYSGGVKRRLNLALGLLRDPQILYLDEPTVGIDAQSRFFILQAIEQLNAQGKTIIYTSHYMEEVEQICDAAAIIDYGRVLIHDSMSNLLHGGRQLLVTPANTPTTLMLDTLESQVGATWDGACLTLTPTVQQPVSRLLAALEQQGIQVEKLQMGTTRLEQVYLGATQHELRH